MNIHIFNVLINVVTECVHAYSVERCVYSQKKYINSEISYNQMTGGGLLSFIVGNSGRACLRADGEMCNGGHDSWTGSRQAMLEIYLLQPCLAEDTSAVWDQ